MKNQKIYKALTIASSDSSGGAGIQADLKAFLSLGVEGSSVITCVTSQNTKEIKEIFELPPNIIESQIDAVMQDINPKATKTGMLYSKEIIELISKKLEEYSMKPVVDPVMTSTIGSKLITQDFVKSLKKKLIPNAKIITPNLFEASGILGWKVITIDDMRNACLEIYEFGCDYVLLKGGHLKKEATDILYMGQGKFRKFSAPLSDKNVHGTGCTFSALITAFLAKDLNVEKSVYEAKNQITNAIKYSIKIGQGIEIANPLILLYTSAERYNVLKELKQVIEKLEAILSSFVPEVGINIAYALPYASSLNDICALEGRIILVNNKPKIIGGIDFGASKHVAKIVLAAMWYNPEMRCAINIKYSKERVEDFKQLGFKIGSFNRLYEPKEVSTMEWGTKEVISKLGFCPDIIYDKGDVGKEPMIRILGENPKDVFNKLKTIMALQTH